MIRTMSQDDLERVLDWATGEGWNPGLDDAAAFLAADPAGFLVKETDGEPVAAISVVNHARDFAFLGLFICHPDHRGQGHGRALWQSGLAHAGSRTIGLDAVLAQRERYAEEGFVAAGQTIRYAGTLRGWESDFVRAATTTEAATLVRMDRRASGIGRAGFLTGWFKGAPSRRTMVAEDAEQIVGYATVRICRDGLKVGPFFAGSRDVALPLLEACVTPEREMEISIDIPIDASDMIALAEDLGFTPGFETVRMYRGAPPAPNPPAFHAIATLELG